MIHLTKASYTTSVWAGGTTTQIAIYPKTASYSDRNFLWRISSAVVELPESDFTALPDYNRLISILDGELALRHNGGTRFSLVPLAVHAFDGGDDTHAWGICRDFNLMLRKGAYDGSMEALCLQPGSHTAAAGTTLFYCVSGGGTIRHGDQQVSFSAEDSVLLEREHGQPEITCSCPTVLMAVSVRPKERV